MDDLKKLLARLDQRLRDDQGFTSPEFAQQADISQATANRRLRECVNKGLITTCIVKRANVHGVQKNVPGYRMVTP